MGLKNGKAKILTLNKPPTSIVNTLINLLHYFAPISGITTTLRCSRYLVSGTSCSSVKLIKILLTHLRSYSNESMN